MVEIYFTFLIAAMVVPFCVSIILEYLKQSERRKLRKHFSHLYHEHLTDKSEVESESRLPLCSTVKKPNTTTKENTRDSRSEDRSEAVEARSLRWDNLSFYDPLGEGNGLYGKSESAVRKVCQERHVHGTATNINRRR